jgi:O-antigen ligase
MPDVSRDLAAQDFPSAGEKAFVWVALFLSTGACQNLWLNTHVAPTQNANVGSASITLLIYLVTLVLLALHCKGWMGLFLREWPLVTISGLAIISAIWSEAPAVSIRYGTGLLFTFLFGVYFAVRYSLKEQISLLASVLGICIVCSFIFGLFGLGTSVDVNGSVAGWYGAFTQKNSLGAMMVLSTLVFLLWRRIDPDHSGIASMGVLGSLILVLLSQSVTSIVTVALLLALFPYLRWMARAGGRRFVAGVVCLASAVLFSLAYLVTHVPTVTALMGKSMTLTGRLQLWVFSILMALRRPWLGYGLGAFWMNDEGAVRIQRALGWPVPHSHNGFLEIWLGLGVCGLVVFLCGFTLYVWRSLRFLLRNPIPEAAWPFLFFMLLFLTNLTQVTFLARNTIFMVMYSTVAVSTAPASSVGHKWRAVAMPNQEPALQS